MTPTRGRRGCAERGWILIATTISMLVLIPVAGLAIDTTILYLIKGQLAVSTDAAAGAAVRGLEGDVVPDVAWADAQRRAQAFFRANFPADTWSTRNVKLLVSRPAAGLHAARVEVRAEADAPVFFFRLFGVSSSRIAAYSRA